MKRFKEWSRKPISRGGHLKFYTIGFIISLIIGLGYMIWLLTDIPERVSAKLTAVKKKIYKRIHA